MSAAALRLVVTSPERWSASRRWCSGGERCAAVSAAPLLQGFFVLLAAFVLWGLRGSQVWRTGDLGREQWGRIDQFPP